MNKPKVILLDIDGVLIKLPHYFSGELETQGYKNSGDCLNSFFHGEDSRQCLEGKADAQISILPYLEKFSWNGSAEDYFRKQFDFERKYLDESLMLLVEKFRSEGVKCYLCTDQMANRAKFILNDMDFESIFDGHFISCHVGFRKCHDGFWKHVVGYFEKEFPELRRDEIIFFDDIQNNVDVATKFGIRAMLYENIEQPLNLFAEFSPSK